MLKYRQQYSVKQRSEYEIYPLITFYANKIKIIDSPYFSIENFSAIPDKTKYIARKPKIANRFEVNTINGSVVTAK